MAIIWKRKNTICKTKDAQGNWFEDLDGISHAITKEFQNRFMSDNMVNSLQAIPLSRDIIDVDNEFLTKDVTNEDILETIKHINPLKAPSPDGMKVIFYQKNWDIVGKSVCNMVRQFFNSGHMLKELNWTYITLIP